MIVDAVDRTAPEGGELAPTRPQQFAGLAIPVPTIATYDTTTEGKTGWRFVLTRRWLAFFVGVLVYIAGCAAGVIWQAQLGAQIAEFNAAASQNYNAPVQSLDRVLPSLGAYTASEQFTPVTVTGSYLVSKQLYVRQRTCDGQAGYEVLTPFSMSDGRILVIDRGCVGSTANLATIAAPPTGTVTLTARIVRSEPRKTAASLLSGDPSSSTHLVDAIDLPAIAPRLGAPTYTGAYGMLASQRPAPAASLHRVLTHKPTLDASAQDGTIFATALYAIVGLVIFGYALREKFRWVNRFSPKLWAKEWKRIQRLARKPYTDAEIEDMLVEGHDQSTIAALEAATKAAGTAGAPRSLE